MIHTMRNILASLLVVLALAPVRADDKVPVEIPKRSLPQSHTIRDVEGWRVRVDDRLLTGENTALGARALKVVEAKLVLITLVMPEKPLAELRKINIQLDLDYGGLKNMQYHPGADWLRANGYNVDVVKCVHIPEAKDLLNPYESHRQPWVMLHELSHGYHDQVLGFDEPRITEVWKKFRDSGKYRSVLTSPGHEREHYGMTNQKEFFAEMTEAYFGSNDFYPFVAGELKQAEPGVFSLMEEIWGPLPGNRKK